MKFIKAGEIADSNIFNKLDERKKSLLEGGMDVINLSIGTPDFQPGRHVMEARQPRCARPGYVQVFAERNARAARRRRKLVQAPL